RSRTSRGATRPSRSRPWAYAPIRPRARSRQSAYRGTARKACSRRRAGVMLARTMARRPDVRATRAVDIVDTAYRLDGTEAEWLAAVLACARPDLDIGCGVYAFTG